jgi:hypothetical protein
MNILNIFFDKIYVITCLNLIERHDYIKNYFNSLNLKFEFKPSVLPEFLSDAKITKTEKSLVLGHANCIIDAKLNNYKHILICEDDVEFISNIESQFETFINILPPDWHFLQMGNYSCSNIEWLKRNKICDNLYRFKFGTGSHCIGINNTSYDQIIKSLTSCEFPSDFSYYSLYSHMNCYCPELFFADQISKSGISIDQNLHKFIFDSTIKHTCEI